MNFNTITFEQKNNVGILTFSRPEKMNALSEEMFTELNKALDIISADKSIKALIVTGIGAKAFVAGADIAELNRCDETTGSDFSRFGSNVFVKLERMKIPVIAAINGFALGGGCEAALACHIRFASTNAKLGQPEINLGIIPGYGGTQRLTKIAGRARALDLLLSGRMITAAEGESFGIINAVFEPDELMQKSLDYAEMLASKPTIAIEKMLDCVNFACSTLENDGLEYESFRFGELCGTADFREGTSAFLEKRKPVFKGA
jgi:enoyl-CoA hydratase